MNIPNNYCTGCGDRLTEETRPFDNATFCLDCGEAEAENDIARGELEAFEAYMQQEEEAAVFYSNGY